MNTRQCMPRHFLKKYARLLFIVLLSAIVSGCAAKKPQTSTHGYVSPTAYFDIPLEERLMLESRSASGDGEAAHRLYLYYALCIHDNPTSLRWLKRSVELEYPKSEYSLGTLMLYHPDVKDEAAGFDLIKKAASRGYEPAVEAVKRNRK